MKDINKVVDEKKYDVLLKLIMMLHRENLEIIRAMLTMNLKPDKSKEIFTKYEEEWEKIQNQIIEEGFKVKEEDLND